MATDSKDFKIKNGLIVQGATATVNGNNVITEASSIADISDVDTSGATDLQALVYNASTGTWIPGEAVGGGSGSYTISATAPESPEAGDVWFDSTDGKSYIYYEDVDTSQWLEIGSRQPGPTGATGATGPQGEPGRFTTSDTEPSNPVDGDVWFNTSNGAILVYYTDADSSQWVESGYPVLGYQTIAGLTDTQISSLQDGEALVYDSTAGKWVNQIIDPNPYNKSTSETGFLALPVGGDADRPVTPANGYIRFNTDSGEPEYYSELAEQWFPFREAPVVAFDVEYLLIAGGAGGGGNHGGGGGAGGYKTGIFEASLSSYPITVGAGGAGGASAQAGSTGSDSVAFSITSIGGGGGGTRLGTNSTIVGQDGGSGGGGAGTNPVTAGVAPFPAQGNNGGNGSSDSVAGNGGGGGGAGQVGEIGTGASGSGKPGDGGDGLQSTITGSAIFRAGGGGGGRWSSGATSVGGAGGGGAGGSTDGDPGDNAQTNTGSGGGGAGGAGAGGGSGGSGVVVLKYPENISLSVTSGLVHDTATSGGFSVTTFTAGTGTVTFS